MPPDASLLDLIAVCWFLGIWMLFPIVQTLLLRGRTSVNQHLVVIRRHWMGCMLDRDNRIMDAQLVGHTMNSCTFFASTSILILAGLIGGLGAVDRIHIIINRLSFVAHTSQDLLEIKLLLLISIFILSFFQFTWSLRQFNYCCALIGSAPPSPVSHSQRSSMGRDIGMVLTQAINTFNSGMRAYYFALAMLAWFIHPIALIVAAGGVLFVLVYRQGFSPAKRYIAAQVDSLQAG